MANYIEHGDDIAFHPGYYILEAWEGKKYYPELAKDLGVSDVDLVFILAGYKDIDKNLARNLSEVFGTSEEYWINIQNTFNNKVKEWKNEVI